LELRQSLASCPAIALLAFGECSVFVARMFACTAFFARCIASTMMRQAKKVADPDQLPIGLLLAEGLKDTFPCDEKH
jgi:hypothetical protein